MSIYTSSIKTEVYMEGFTKFFEKNDLIREMSSMGIDPRKYDLDRILNEINWRKSLAAGALALAPFISGAENKQLPPDVQPAPYTYNVQRSYGDAKSVKQQEDDKKYIAVGGLEYEGSIEDAEHFTSIRKTKNHQELLKKAGLDRNYIPSTIKKFVFGTDISSVHGHSNMSGKITDFKSGIVKKLGRDSFVDIIKQETLKDGGTIISANISGIIMAMNQKDAEARVESQIKQVIEANGFNLGDMSVRVNREFQSIEPAPRSTIDYTKEWFKESNGVSQFKYEASVVFKVRNN